MSGNVFGIKGMKRLTSRRFFMTIEDIAKRAGVSVATVSRVLNGSGYVSPKTREKVLKVIEEVGYKRRYSAHVLARRKVFNVGVVISERIRKLLREEIGSFYNIILNSILENAASFHFAIECVELEKEPKGKFNAFLILGSDATEDDIKKFMSRGKVVLVDHHVDGLNVDCVLSAGYDAAYFLVKRFLNLGKSRIVHLHGPLKYYGFRNRYEGYISGMQAFGLLPITFEYDELHEEIDGVLKKILSKHRPDVIFCSNDVIALQALEKLQQFGYKVPDDVSVVGFDDIPEAEQKGLSTFCVRKYEMGVIALRKLYDLLYEHDGGPSIVSLYADFIKRASSL